MRLPMFDWMKAKDETIVDVAAVAAVDEIKVEKSTLTTIPPENPIIINMVLSKLMDENLTTV